MSLVSWEDWKENFDPDDNSNDDDQLPSENAYFKWIKIVECQICGDKEYEDNLDFNSDEDEHTKLRRFYAYRYPFMKMIDGRRACPDCQERRGLTPTFNELRKLRKVKQERNEKKESGKTEKAENGKAE